MSPLKNLKKSIENFFYHYKFHTFFGICLALFIIAISYALIKGQIENAKERNRPPADVEILLFSQYELAQNDTQIQDNFATLIPEWNIATNIKHTPSGSGLDITTIATERPDIYIFDTHQFNKYVSNGSFYKFEEDFIEQVGSEKLLYSQLEDDTQSYPFGVDISKSTIFEGVELVDSSKVAVIRNESDNIDKALQLIKKVIDTTH